MSSDRSRFSVVSRLEVWVLLAYTLYAIAFLVFRPRYELEVFASSIAVQFVLDIALFLAALAAARRLKGLSRTLLRLAAGSALALTWVDLWWDYLHRIVGIEPDKRYCQMLWIGSRDQAASCSTSSSSIRRS